MDIIDFLTCRRLILISLRYILLSDFVSIVIGNTFVVLTIILVAHGLNAFAGNKQKYWLKIPSLTLVFIVSFYFIYVTPDLQVRIAVSSFFIALFSADAALILLKDVPRVVMERNWLLILNFMFQSFWFFLRCIRALMETSQSTDLLDGGWFQKATFLISIELSIVTYIGLIILNAQRVEFDLKTAHDEINTLKRFVPICASCKKIRDDKGFWNQLESYLDRHMNVAFSHGICPDCREKLYPELKDMSIDKKNP